MREEATQMLTGAFNLPCCVCDAVIDARTGVRFVDARDNTNIFLTDFGVPLCRTACAILGPTRAMYAARDDATSSWALYLLECVLHNALRIRVLPGVPPAKKPVCVADNGRFSVVVTVDTLYVNEGIANTLVFDNGPINVGTLYTVAISEIIRGMLTETSMEMLPRDDEALVAASGFNVALGPPSVDVILLCLSAWGIFLELNTTTFEVGNVRALTFVETGKHNQHSVRIFSPDVGSRVDAVHTSFSCTPCIRMNGDVEAIVILLNACAWWSKPCLAIFNLTTGEYVLHVSFERIPSYMSMRVCATTTLAKTSDPDRLFDECVPLAITDTAPSVSTLYVIRRVPLRWTWILSVLHFVGTAPRPAPVKRKRAGASRRKNSR